MKKMKKVLAVLIALLVVCGLPFAAHAVGTGEEDLAVVQALVVPDYIAQAANLPEDRAIMLCFNKDVTLVTSGNAKTRVGFGIVVGQDGNDYGTAYGNCVLGGVSGNSIRPDATIAVTTALSTTKNNIVVTLPEGFTVSELFSRCEEKNGMGSKFRVVLRLYDYTRGIDDFIDGISYVDGENTVKLAAKNNPQNIGCETNANISINKVTTGENTKTFDFYDIPIITEDDALTVKSAKWVADNKVTVTFSQPVNVRKTGTSNDIYSGIRLVNSKGQLMRYREGDSKGVKYYINARDTDTNATLSASEDLQAAVNLTNGQSVQTATIPANQKAKLAIDGFAVDSPKNLSWFNAHLEACQAEHPDEEFQIVYLVQENTVYADRCEGKNNWYISGLYGSESGLPLMATNNGKTGGDATDLAIVKTTAAIDVDGLYYADMASAVTAASQTSKITLLDDVTVDSLMDEKGITLDLNGNILSAGTVSAIAPSSKIIDSSDGQGGIQIAKNSDNVESLQISANSNEYLPLYDASMNDNAGGYRFFKCTLVHKQGETTYNGAFGYRFGYQMDMSDEAFKLLVDANGDDMLDADIQLSYNIKIEVNGVEKDMLNRYFKTSILTEYGTKESATAGQTHTATLKVTGFDVITDQTVTITSSAPQIVSSTGVLISASDATLTYTYPN